MTYQHLFTWASWLALSFLAFWPARPSRGPSWSTGRASEKHRLYFFILLLATLLIGRAPMLVCPNEIDRDESAAIGQALGYSRHLIPFTEDGTTIGPLNSYVLLWPLLLNQPISYFSVRLTGLILIYLTLVFLILTVSKIVGRRFAYLVCLPLIGFYVFAYQPNFVRYSSEDPPIALLAISSWLVAVLWKKPDWRTATFLGLFLGAIPFTKLQGGPPAAYLFLLGLGIILAPCKPLIKSRRTIFIQAISLTTGLILVPLLMGVLVASAGLLSDATHRYFLGPLRYGSTVYLSKPIPFPNLIYYFAIHGIQITVYLLGLMACCTAGIWLLISCRWRPLSKTWSTGLMLALGYFVISSYVMLRPNLPFPHYMLFLLAPALLLTAWLVRGCRLFLNPRKLTSYLPYGIALFIGVSFLSLASRSLLENRLPSYTGNVLKGDSANPDPVSAYINSLSSPQDSISIWGAVFTYYVATQLPPATTDFTAFYALMPDKKYDYYREAYIRELKQSKPRFFIDCTGEFSYDQWPHPAERSRYTSYAPLAQFIEDNYRLGAKIIATPGNPPVWVFVRK